MLTRRHLYSLAASLMAGGLLIITLLFAFRETSALQSQTTATTTAVETTALCGVYLNTVGEGLVELDPPANYDPELSVEIEDELSYVVLENSKLYVRFEEFTDLYDNTEQFAIRQFKLKANGINQAGSYLDAGYGRGELKSATLTYNGPDRKTVRLEWYTKQNNPSVNKNAILVTDVSIFPNEQFLKLDYHRVDWSIVVVDLGAPGGIINGQPAAYGSDAWVRGFVTDPEFYYTRVYGSDPADGGSLSYNGHFIAGLYNPANNVGYGRAIPVARTHSLRFLLSDTQRRGMESSTPKPNYLESYTSFLYAVSGGANEIVSEGQRLVDGNYGDFGVDCGDVVTFTAQPDAPEWAFDAWSGDLITTTNPVTMTVDVDKYVTASFVDVMPPSIESQVPAPGATDVAPNTSIELVLQDAGEGVDTDSIVLKVNGSDVSGQVTTAGTPDSLTLTYEPDEPFSSDSTVNVSVSACDLAAAPNCVGPVTYSFDTLPNEPPIISDVQVIAGAVMATVKWKTNEPATSQVDFGTTAVYDSTVSDTTLRTQHSLNLTGLTPETLYHFMITSADEFAAESMTDDATFETQPFGGIVSDDFNTCELNSFWSFANPLADSSYTLTDREVEIVVPAGSNHDIWPSNGQVTNRAPRLMQAVTSPENLEVKFGSGLNKPIQMQGVLIHQNAENFLRINFQYDTDSTVRLYVIGFASGQSPKILKSAVVNGATPTGPMWLSVTRPGGNWDVKYSMDGETWTSIGPVSFALSVTSAGVFAGNSAQNPGTEPAMTAVVDYFFDSTLPIEPEDGTALRLPVDVVGNGSVTRSTECGNPVTLTAVPDNGWQFAQWQDGPLDGTTAASVTTSFDWGDSVTAVFEEIQYTLDVEIVNDGQGEGGYVTVDPSQATYTLGETVTLTANPNPGWVFSGWGGDASGSDLTTELTIDADTTIVALFTQEQYTLTVNIDGQGAVTMTPDKDTYTVGETVTLTAVPATDWLFQNWQGDATGTAATRDITITADTDVTAVFVEAEIVYTLYLPGLMRAP